MNPPAQELKGESKTPQLSMTCIPFNAITGDAA